MRRYGALLTLGVTLALTCGTATLAHAVAPTCSTVVTDDAGVLTPAQIAELRKHAAGLAAKTELRIRTEQSLFTGTLNGDEGSLQQDCKWATSAGVRQPRLLVIMVATESRQMGIYPGTAMVGRITKPVWLSIEQKDMRPHFAKADWVGGLEAGIDALSAKLPADLTPTTPPPSAPAASSAAAPSATEAAASVSDAGQGAIQSEPAGTIAQANGSGQQPVLSDPNGGLSGSGAVSSGGTNLVPIIAIVAAVAVIGAIVGVVGLSLTGSSGRRGHYGPDGMWINTPSDPGNHNPGMFGGGFDGGGGGGFDGGGGGGSSSDGGGGSSGF